MKSGITTACVTDKGLSAHYTVNEDSYLILELDGAFAVADGVGGANAGDLASQTALRTISKLIKEARGNTPPTSLNFVRSLIDAGNQVVYQLGQQRQRQVASTIALMLIKDGVAILGHVGDSRIYVHREDKLIQLTKDHSKLQNLIDNSLITEKERADFQERHIITKALGAGATVEPDLQKVILKKNDLFILCTDGIYIHNTDEEILRNATKNKNNLAKICDTLKKNCYSRGAKDNLTAIVVKVEGQEFKKGSLAVSQDMMDTVIKK
ncbi:MAG: PP2C family protein-serine/threonine phosphatase [bacterium]